MASSVCGGVDLEQPGALGPVHPDCPAVHAGTEQHDLPDTGLPAASSPIRSVSSGFISSVASLGPRPRVPRLAGGRRVQAGPIGLSTS